MTSAFATKPSHVPAGGRTLAEWPSILLVPFAIGALVDFPRVVHFGSVTALGALALLQFALASVALIIAGRYPRQVIARLLLYALFVVWMIGRSLVDLSNLRQGGFQNALAYLLFGAQFLLAGTLAGHSPVATLSTLRRGFVILDAIALALASLSFLLSVLLGSTWLVGQRAIALLAIVPIGWHLAHWCYGHRGSGTRALAWIFVVVASLSRTATVVALITTAVILMAALWTKPVRLIRQLPALGMAALILIGLVLSFRSAFYDRFFNEYNLVSVAGITVSAAGRNHIWPVVIESGMQHPIVGGGLGSSLIALSDFDSETVGHPHNDYLRVWHDGGVPAVTFLLLAFFQWLAVLGRQWLRHAREPWFHPEADLAAFLALLGIMLASITDNGLVYTFVVSLAGTLLGAAVGLRSREAVRVRHPLSPRFGPLSSREMPSVS